MRTLPASIDTATQDAVVSPVYLVEMGFASPIRLCSRGTATLFGQQFLDASMTVRASEEPVVEIFNENTQLGQIILTEGTAGRYIDVYQAFLSSYSPSYTVTDYVSLFSGEMRDATITEVIKIRCKLHAPANSPRTYVQEPAFNHLLAPGTRIKTQNQVIVID